MQPHNVRTLLLCGLAFLMGSVACSDSPSSPGVQPEITNETDSFAYQVSSVKDYSGMASYTWENTGTAASVDISSAPASGSAVIVMADAEGNHVFSEPVSASGSFPSAAGSAGFWTVRVYYASFTGTVNFRAQKKT
ncbi:MAG: hypothetical protein OEO21_01910 [Candidatus Krumholzibacteria bacterium]|nr:hypothetical protein [Candidatus Krumholzibacteria bacterium]